MTYRRKSGGGRATSGQMFLKRFLLTGFLWVFSLFVSCYSYVISLEILNYVTNVASKTSHNYYIMSGCSKHLNDYFFDCSASISCVQYVGYQVELCHDSG